MGVDWIPCRVEDGHSREEMEDVARLEAAHFRHFSGYSEASMDPRPAADEAAVEAVRSAYADLGPLHGRLLFKYHQSHRVSVVSGDELFPLEWRVDSQRTILPWQLDSQLSSWSDYRDEVRRGMHRPYLRHLYVFVQVRELLRYTVGNLLAVVESSRTATGGWANRPEVEHCREQILSEPIIDPVHPPAWPDAEGEADLSAVIRAAGHTDAAVGAWNRVVQRGNYRARPPERVPRFDEWIASRLAHEWFESFLAWAEPWRQGGYGLYRDCE